MEKQKQVVQSELIISEDVIAAIALKEAKDVEGVVGFSDRQTIFSKKDGAARSVRVLINDNEVKIHLYLTVSGTCRIQEVCSQVQRNVKGAVQNMTGRVVTKVNISIVGADFTEPTELQK